MEKYIILPKQNKFLSAWHFVYYSIQENSFKISRDKIIQIFFKSEFYSSSLCS